MKKIIRNIILIILTIIIIITGVIGVLGYQEYRSVIDERPLVYVVKNVMDDGTYVELDSISDMVEIAMISVEDKRFYERKGVLDFRSLGRAILTNLSAMKLVEGGSTIPQQLAKNLYFDHEASFVRKVSEYLVTKDLVATYDKDTLLELYLNIAYYGDGYFGIEQAAQGYFNVSSEHLSDAQATLVVGIVQSPTNYQLSNHYDRAKIRQRTVLSRLVEQGIVTQEEADLLYEGA